MIEHDFQHLIKFLEETPQVVRQLIGRLTNEELRWKPNDQDFSILEHVCHLNDIEREGYAVRIKKMTREEKPFLPDIDGDKLAEERDYNNQNIDIVLSAFEQARKNNVTILRALTLDQLDRCGVFETVGHITLGKLLLMIIEHDNEHISALCSLCSRFSRGNINMSGRLHHYRLRSDD